MEIDPWSSAQYEDYARLRDEFGIEEFDPTGLPDPSPIYRRGIVFGQRGFDAIKLAIMQKKPFTILTGLMPSGRMHLGHKMVIDQVRYYQDHGANVVLAVADIESYATRNMPLETAEKLAIEEYLINYIAMGLKEDKCQVYFQSKRSLVKDLAFLLGKKLNWSTIKAIYGFEDSTNMSHILSPLIQAGDILHPQHADMFGPTPLLVPVGVDQDPHMRLCRDIAASHRLMNVTHTKDDRIGVFVKGEDDVEKLLNMAKEALSKTGFLDFELNVGYKALYVPGAAESDMPTIEEVLINLEKEINPLTFFLPSSSYHRFMTGLDGGKMSSSKPNTAIFLTDEPDDARKKVMRAITGGGMTVEEHKANGGKPDQCTIFEMFLYHLSDDDEELVEIQNTCKAGERMCGHCKRECADRLEVFLKDLAEKREDARLRVERYIRYD